MTVKSDLETARHPLEHGLRYCVLVCIMGFQVALFGCAGTVWTICDGGVTWPLLHHFDLLAGMMMTAGPAIGAMLGRGFFVYNANDTAMNVEGDVESGSAARPMELNVIEAKAMCASKLLIYRFSNLAVKTRSVVGYDCPRGRTYSIDLELSQIVIQSIDTDLRFAHHTWYKTHCSIHSTYHEFLSTSNRHVIRQLD